MKKSHPGCFNNWSSHRILIRMIVWLPATFWGRLHSTWSSLIRVSLSRTWTYVDDVSAVRQQVEHDYPSRLWLRTVTLKVNTTDAQHRLWSCWYRHSCCVFIINRLKRWFSRICSSLLWPRPLFLKHLNNFLLKLYSYFQQIWHRVKLQNPVTVYISVPAETHWRLPETTVAVVNLTVLPTSSPWQHKHADV